MKKILTLGTLFVALLVSACKHNNCTCPSCLDPNNTEKCCLADDNTGGGCYGDPTLPVRDVPFEEQVDPNTLEPNFEDDVIGQEEYPDVEYNPEHN
jgi:hypothetical protein